MKADLPLEVLSLMSPLLSWVEGTEDLSMPETWVADALNREERQRAWLVHQLPTYSYDTIDDLVELSRSVVGDDEEDEDGTSPRAPFRPRHRRKATLDPPEGYDLANAFDRLTQRYFLWDGGQLLVREGRMEELHELGLRFPVGHLIRHDHARSAVRGWISDRQAEQLPEQMSRLPSNAHSMRSIVRRGLSEGHLHLKGVHSAEENWAEQLLKHPTAEALQGFRPHEKRLLILSRNAAQVLALAILASLQTPEPRDRETTEPDEPSLLQHLGRLLRQLDRLYFARTQAQDHMLRRQFHDALRREVLASHSVHQALHDLAGTDQEWLVRWIHPAAHRLQPLFVPGRRGQKTSPHFVDRQTTEARTRWLERLHFQAHRQLLQLHPDNPQRHYLHAALHRYLIFRTHHWQLATQYGKTTGLRRFKRFYDSRNRKPLREDPSAVKRLILQRLQNWRGLRVLEGRVSPPERGAQDLQPWVLGFAEGARKGRIKKFGLVIHFIKDDYSHFEDWANRLGYPALRYGRMRRRVRGQAIDLFRLMSSPHPAVPFIVGIDAANLELTSPPEIFAPAFRFLRALPLEPIYRRRGPVDRRLDDIVRKLVGNRRVGMTYHVGEDFRHLLSGLRAIDEVIEYFDPQPGDRLGHAIALALDPEIWARQCEYQAVVPRLEWLDTLVWVLHLLGSRHERIGRLSIVDRIQKLSWEIYRGKGHLTRHVREEHMDPEDRGRARRRHLEDALADSAASEPDWSPLTLHDAWRLRQLDPYSLEVGELRKGRCKLKEYVGSSSEHRRWRHVQERAIRDVQEHVGSAKAYYLLNLYWFDREVRLRGREKILVDMQKQEERKLWLELFRDAQRAMMEKVHRKELVVEVNPSVNRIIGPMRRLEDHHVFRLTLDENRQLKRTVRVTVNTDNPAVFSTSLAHEYYVLGEVLIKGGMPEAQVMEWLEWLRKNGEEYSFVRQLPDADDPELRLLLEGALAHFRPSVRHHRKPAQQWHSFWAWMRGYRRHRQRSLHLAFAENPTRLTRQVLELREDIDRLRQRADGEG